MGVPYLCSKLLKKFNVHYQTIQSNSKVYCNNVYIDFNAILHSVINEHGVHSFHENLSNTLMDIISFTRPMNIIYIATDGVPPKAKMIQQRYRRYISASNEIETVDSFHKNFKLKTQEELESLFDKNNISPGTTFMSEVSKYIKETFIPKYKTINSSVKIIYSTDSSPSEGEHKIISYIKKNYNLQQTHIIYGLDADLITLSMLAQNKKIMLLRKMDSGDHIMIHVNNITKGIFGYISKKIDYLDLDKDSVILDINYLLFFLGNDFLPYLFELNLNNNGLEVLIESYIELLQKYPSYLIIDNKINFKQLYNFFLFVSKKTEPLQKSEEISYNTLDYLKTSYWCILYYNKYCPTYNWGYGYINPPSIRSILTCIKTNYSILSSIRFEYTPPCSELEQLLFILPKNSIKNLLPLNYHKVLSEYSDYYPETFEVYFPKDISVEWQSRCLLPELNFDYYKFASFKNKNTN